MQRICSCFRRRRVNPIRRSAFAALLFALSLPAFAGQKGGISVASQPVGEEGEPELSTRARLILADTLRYHSMFDSIAIRYDQIPTGRFASPLLTPVTFHGLDPSNYVVKDQPTKRTSLTGFDDEFSWLATEVAIDSLRERVVQRCMAANPMMIDYDYFSLPNAPKKERITHTMIDASLKISAPTLESAKLNVGLPKADKWVSKMTSSLQFSQNYVSDNWYQGGESNLNILSLQSYSLTKYDDTKRTEFTLTIDLKTGFYTTTSDTLRSFRVNDDLLQINAKYGIKARERWYYTSSVLFKTQLFNNYKANTDDLQAQFLSPAEMNLSLGLDYKFTNKKKSFTWSLLLAPAAYNLKCVANIRDIDETRFGITEGKHTLNQVGSSITNNFTWTISKNVNWVSYFFLFSNYHKVQSDFQNTFNFTINRYFTTRLALNVRFDDDTDSDDFQYKELLSIGFNYVW